MLKDIWSNTSIRGVAGQTAKHENEQYDWSGTDHPILRQYMTRLTEPGATKMWDGWFTTHWIPIISDMAKRRKPNMRPSEAHDIAVKTARNIRYTIKDGLYKMWKIRNDIKHGGKQKHRWNEAQITQIITELQKKTGKRERRTVTEIMKWRKKKIDKWVASRRQEIEEAKIKQEEMKIAMRNFGTQYKIFTVEPTDKDKEEKQGDEETDKKKEEIKDTKKKPRDKRHRKLKQTTITMMMTRREDTTEQENQTDDDSGTAEIEGDAESDNPNTRDTSDGDETTREGTAELAKVFGEEWMRAWKTLHQERLKWITEMEMEPEDMREGTVELAKVLGAKWMVGWKTRDQERLKKRTKLEPEDTETEASESETSESTTSESETSETETSDAETSEAETTESETAEMAISETELAELETTKKAQQESKLPETESSNKRKDAEHMTKQENTMNKRQRMRNTRDIGKKGHTRGNTRDTEGRKRKRRKTTDKDGAHRKTDDIDETEIENTAKTERRHKKKIKEGIG